MSLQIITADQRIAEATVKGQIWGPAGVGKTTLLKTLDGPSTLAISAEGGMLSVQRDDDFGPRYMGDTIEPGKASPGQPALSDAQKWLEIDAITKGFEASPRPPALAKYRTVFIDSTTVITKWCFAWCQTQPEAFSDKKTTRDGSPAPDTRGAYGLLGRTMSDWAWSWKNMPGVNVWLVGGLSYSVEDGHRPELMGQATKNALPFIMDYVLVMDRMKMQDGRTYTGFFTSAVDFPQYATVPIKTRGCGFDAFAQPHLGRFMAKALGQPPASAPAAA